LKAEGKRKITVQICARIAQQLFLRLGRQV
jgi:hypothetical protein